MGNNDSRLKQLDTLLAIIDSPREGDKVLFTLVGDPNKYQGKIKKRQSGDSASVYEIVPLEPAPRGTVDTIEFKGRTFRTGGWSSDWKKI